MKRARPAERGGGGASSASGSRGGGHGFSARGGASSASSFSGRGRGRGGSFSRGRGGSSFASRGGGTSSRGGGGAGDRARPRRRMDEEIDLGGVGSDEEDDGPRGNGSDEEEEGGGFGEEAEAESADAVRLRVAKEYLHKLARSAASSSSSSGGGDGAGGRRGGVDHLDSTQLGGDEEDEEDEEEGGAGGRRYDVSSMSQSVRDAVAAQLKQEGFAAAGTLFRRLSKVYQEALASSPVTCIGGGGVGAETAASAEPPANAGKKGIQVVVKRGHQLPATAIAVSADGRTAFTSSKDCSIVRWSIDTSTGWASKSAVFAGRRRTKADVARQLAAAGAGKKGVLPVFGAAFGGGRLGTSLARRNTEGDEGTSGATQIEKITRSVGGVASITVVDTAPPSAKAAAIARMRGLPDYGIVGHWDDVLCLALSPDGQYLASGAKDKTVRVWDATAISAKKTAAVAGVTGSAGAAASSSSSSSSAAAGAGPSASSSSSSKSSSGPAASFVAPLETFVGHKDSVTALSFRPGTRTLYTAGADRLLKVWSVDTMAHMDTLFGHQAEVNDLTCVGSGKDRCVTAGRDKTARLWKIAEQSQLIFRAHNSDISVECVRAIGDSHFVTGSQDGSLCLWSMLRKKPIFTVHNAHGSGMAVPVADMHSTKAAASASSSSSSSSAPPLSLASDADGAGPPAALLADIEAVTGCSSDSLSGGYCNWVTAIAVLPNSDVIATGSGDGFIRLWRLVPVREDGSQGGTWTLRGLQHIGGIPCPGIITGLAFGGTEGAILLASVGQEHRMGRWWKYTKARNGIAIVRTAALAPEEEEESSSGSEEEEEEVEEEEDEEGGK